MTFSWRDFQIWFEGFSENIEGSPSEKQWERVCKRIADVSGGPDVPAPVQAVVPAAPPAEPKQKRLTLTQWRKQFIETLMDEQFGYDPDTAREMLPGKIDTSIDPAVAARMEHAGGGAMH